MSRWIAATVAAAALVATGLAVLPVPDARANVTVDEVYPVPSSGVFPIEGHGWGHGHGLSQYGAQGGAHLGFTADQIVAFYYCGSGSTCVTAKATQGNPTVRVQLRADNDNATEVYPASGLVAMDMVTGAKTTLPTSGVSRFRALTDSAGLHVQQLVSGTWKPVVIGGKTVHSGAIQFSGPTFVRLALPHGSSRDYRGGIRSVRLSSTAITTIDALPMESYLLGVVPRESSSSWAPAALQAQAIAARSYSEYEREHASSSLPYDICDTTACQVFGGSALYDSSGSKTALEPASTTDAVQATAGVIRTYQGAAIFAQFSASNGGWATDGGQPYLAAHQDDWDGAVPSTVHSWTATVSAAELQARYPSVGRLLRMRVTQRDGNGEWGGRVKAVTLEGVDGSGNATSVATTGAGVYNAHSWPASSDGLRSSWWHVMPALSSSIVSQSAAPRLVQSPGVSTGTLTVTMKNTGTVTWPTHGLHLSVASPPGQADPLVGNSTYPGHYTGTATSIPPDATAAFSFALTGDGVPAGLQGRSYRLRLGLDDTDKVFGATVSWKIPVDLPLFTGARVGPVRGPAAPSGSQAPGAVLPDGRTVVVPVAGSTSLGITVRNTGNITWPVSSSGPIHLGTADPLDRSSDSTGPSWLAPRRPSAIVASASIGPGQTGDLALPLYGNDRPVGVTFETFSPLWEGKHWISGADTSLVVVRVDPSVSRLATVHAAPVPQLNLTNAPDGTASLVVRMRNVGRDPWQVGQEGIVATATPLSTSAWGASTRPPALSKNLSRPGVTAVYPGEVGEWLVPLSAYHQPAGYYPITLQLATPAGAVYGPTMTTTVKVVQSVFAGSVVATAPSVTVPSAGTAATWFDVKNTGNTNWAVGAAVRSEVLTSGGSPSHASTWIAANRPSSITANLTRPGALDIRPGEVARFSFALAGNGRPPTATSEPFGVLWEGWKVLSGLRAVLPYTVA